MGVHFYSIVPLNLALLWLGLVPKIVYSDCLPPTSTDTTIPSFNVEEKQKRQGQSQNFIYNIPAFIRLLTVHVTIKHTG
jgi:hypothetical protein